MPVLFIIANIFVFKKIRRIRRALIPPNYITVLIIPILNLINAITDYETFGSVEFIMPALLLGGVFTAAAEIMGDNNEKEKQNS